MNASQAKNRISIRRNSNKSLSTQFSNENRRSSTNNIDRNEEDIISVKSDRITQTRPNSMSIVKEKDLRNKPSITFVPKRPYTRVERLHGEEFLPLNNDQYAKNPQPEKQDRRSEKKGSNSN